MILKRYTEFPTSIEEFTPKQFLKWVSLLLRFENGSITYNDLKTEFATFLVKRKSNSKQAYFASQIYRLTERLNFLFEEKEKKDKIELHPATTIKNLIPKIRMYYGPSDALQNITFLEYIHAYQYYQEFILDKDERKLDLLIATLYRPKHYFFFGERAKYNSDKTERRSKIFAKLSLETKFGVFYFFKSCDSYLREARISIAGNEIDFGILFKSQDNDTESDGLGMLGVLYKMAESGVFGNIKATAQENFWDVMLKLYQNHKEYLNFKAKQPNK